MSLSNILQRHIQNWAQTHCPGIPPQNWVQPCLNPQFGHFQTNLAMIAAKQLKQNPRELAARLAADLAASPELEEPQVAGPGFVNFRFRPGCIHSSFSRLASDARLGVEPVSNPKTILVDFSAPNVAKAMHVGHIRSTVLGSTLAKLLAFLGHHVITDNHIGDWGTQFGKIILGYKMAGCPAFDTENPIAQMEELYQKTHQACENDPALLEKARAELLRLQQGDPENLALWQRLRDLSQGEFDAIYARLRVTFDHTLGESFYNPWLDQTVDDLLQRGIARETEGAVGVFFPDQPDLGEAPFLIRKSDGAAMYATTDLATLRYRIDHFHTQSILYVTDGRQQLHFKQLFATAGKMGLPVELEHVWFGAILGENKKPLKTREGTPIKLKDLLDEATERARLVLREKRPDLPEEKAAKMAPIIGIGSVKYADQAQNRNLDYVFNWEKLLAFDGNTAPYLLNAYVRTRAILRKVGSPGGSLPVSTEHPMDLDLARRCLDYGDVLILTAREYRPHYLCQYLYDLASQFHRFYEACPVGQASSPELKNTRLLLCQVTGNILKHGLDLLGIEALEEM